MQLLQHPTRHLFFTGKGGVDVRHLGVRFGSGHKEGPGLIQHGQRGNKINGAQN